MPWRDDPDVRAQRVGAEFEAHLIVAFAGRAMRDRLGAGQVGDLDHPLRDQRPGDRGAEQIFALVHGVGAEHRKDVIAHELLAQVLDVDVLRRDPELQRFRTRRFEFVALAEIGGEGHHFAVVGILQPLQDH